MSTIFRFETTEAIAQEKAAMLSTIFGCEFNVCSDDGGKHWQVYTFELSLKGDCSIYGVALV